MVDVSEKMIEAGLAAAKDQLPLYYSTDDEIRAAVHAIYTAMHSAREVDGETVERVAIALRDEADRQLNEAARRVFPPTDPKQYESFARAAIAAMGEGDVR